MHRLFLRPVLVVLTLGMLVVAMFQSVGRLGFMVLDDLELAANQWLSGQQIRVTGLAGSWRFLNPVVMIDRIDLPAGYLTDVVVELDWLESLARNRFVTRRLVVSDGQLLVERREGQWRLAGAGPPGDFDPSGLLYHSDELRFSGAIALRREDEEAAPPVRLRYTATNRGGVHRHQLNLRNEAADCEDPCRSLLEYQAREGLWPFWEEQVQLQAKVKRFRLPKPLLGISAVDVESMKVDWHQRGDDSGGWLSLRVDGVQLPADVVLAGNFSAQIEGHLGVHQALIDDLEIRQTSHLEHVSEPAPFASALRMPVIRLRRNSELVEVWADGLDLGLASEFARNALQGVDAARRWLGKLKVRAQAHNLRGYLRVPTGEFGYAGTLAGIDLDGYRGVPFLRRGAGEIFGFDRGVQFKLKGENMVVQFPDTFTDRWKMPHVQGVVQAWFKDGYIGLRGGNLRAETLFSRVSGGFAVSRPSARYEQRLTLLINVDAVEIEEAKTYVPYKVAPGLAQWISEGPRAGLLSRVRFGYHGQTHLRPGELARRIELTTGISDGEVQYHPDWPVVTDLAGVVSLVGPLVRVEVERASSAGARLPGTRVVLRDNAAYVDIGLDARIGTGAALDFVRHSPLRETLTFVGVDWTGAGELRLQGDLHIPLGREKGEETGQEDGQRAEGVEADDSDADVLGVDLSVALLGTDLDMPDYRLVVNDLNGRLRYQYPNWLRGSDIKGRMFGHDVLLGADSDDDTMTLSFVGHASEADVLRVSAMNDPGVFFGSTDFVANLHIATVPDHVTRLDITSDLLGMEMTLPGEFAKSADLPRPIEISLQFLDDYQVVSFRHGSANGWLHVSDAPVRGAIGFGRAPPVVDTNADHLLLTGRLQGFAIEEVIPGNGGGDGSLMQLRLADLEVGHIDLDEFRIDEALLNGDITASGFRIEVASQILTGNLTLTDDQPLAVTLASVVFPESETDDGEDPLKPQLIAELPAAVVRIDSLKVGEVDYGSWRFTIEPRDDGVLLADIDAELRGVHIVAPEGVHWVKDTNESRFSGELKAQNLADVLPLWGFAPSLETESASLAGNLRWAGSPVNVDLDLLIGEAAVRAENGRFADVDSGGGAMRIFSLMNFNTIAKRMRGDFSDLTGKGVTFDKLEAKVAFNLGSLAFVEPMTVKGTGSSFEVAGTVDLVGGVLDNEMIVTLPVSKSLPWYAAYIALANPLAGAGVLLGERVLRKPLEQFSSAKYEIGGTLDEPDVNLVSVFDTSMKDHVSSETNAKSGVVPPLEATPLVDGAEQRVERGAEQGDEQHMGQHIE